MASLVECNYCSKGLNAKFKNKVESSRFFTYKKLPLVLILPLISCQFVYTNISIYRRGRNGAVLHLGFENRIFCSNLNGSVYSTMYLYAVYAFMRAGIHKKQNIFPNFILLFVSSSNEFLKEEATVFATLFANNITCSLAFSSIRRRKARQWIFNPWQHIY